MKVEGRTTAREQATFHRSAAVIGAICRAEFRMLLRDRRTVIVSIVLPLLITPLLMFGSRWVQERRELRLEASEVRLAVTGSRADSGRALITEAVRPRDDTTKARVLLKEVATQDPVASLANAELEVHVEALSAEEAAARPDTTVEAREDDSVAVPVLILHYREDRDASERGAQRIRESLTELRRLHRVRLLESRGLARLTEYADVTQRNLAAARDVAGLHIGRFLVLTTAALAIVHVGLAVIFGVLAFHASKRGWLRL